MNCRLFCRSPIRTIVHHYRRSRLETVLFGVGSILAVFSGAISAVSVCYNVRVNSRRQLCSTPNVLTPMLGKDFSDIAVSFANNTAAGIYSGLVNNATHFQIPSFVSPPWHNWDKYRDAHGRYVSPGFMPSYKGATTPLPGPLVDIFKNCWDNVSDQVDSASLDKAEQIAMWTGVAVLIVGIVAYVVNQCAKACDGDLEVARGADRIALNDSAASQPPPYGAVVPGR